MSIVHWTLSSCCSDPLRPKRARHYRIDAKVLSVLPRAHKPIDGCAGLYRDCLIENVCPATVIVPFRLRGLPVYGSTE